MFSSRIKAAEPYLGDGDRGIYDTQSWQDLLACAVWKRRGTRVLQEARVRGGGEVRELLSTVRSQGRVQAGEGVGCFQLIGVALQTHIAE
jgi:hypothetical protein